MKKFFLLVPVAALAMTACTSESNEFVGDSQQAREIAISPINQVATRSAKDGTTFPQAYDMMVSAYYNKSAVGGTSADYFEDIQFGYDGTSKWKSEKGAKYYPLEGTLDFLAVASAGYNVAENGIAPTAVWGESSNCAKKVVLTVPANNTKFDDLLYGAANAQPLSATGTNMTFNHAMTSVVFNAKSSVPYNLENNVGITINSITVKNAKQTGTLTISNPSAGGGSGDLTAAWSNLDGAADVAARVWNSANLGNNASEPALSALNLTTSFCDMTTKKFGEGYVIIPAQDAVAFEINYTLHNGKNASGSAQDNTLTYTYTPTGTWDMGKKNVYNITFTLTEIMIVPVVVDWTDGGTEFVDIPTFAAGTARTLDVRAAESTYTFYVTGFTASEAVTIGKTDTNSVIKTLGTGATSADANGILKITFTVNSSSGANDATITIDSANDAHDTTITVSQPAAS